MLNFKSYGIVLFCSLFAFTGCIEPKYNLDIKATFDNKAADFFKNLPGIQGSVYNKMPVTVPAKKMEIYKASFSEATIEKDHLLEFTELNTRSSQPRVTYRDIDGFTQDIYLLKYNFSYSDEGSDVENTAVVFISMHYRPMNTDPFVYCTGPGPAYWGLLNDGYISFDSVLIVKKTRNNNYFVKARKAKKKNAFNLLFMPVDFPENPKETKTAFDIAKIVRMEANKVGGNKPLVFDIPVIFNDSKALRFTYIKTITLNN